MNFEDWQNVWQQQPMRKPDVSSEQLVSAMKKETTRLRRILDARDLRELVACAIVIIIFGIFYFTVYRSPVSRVGTLIVIGSSIFIAWKLIHTRRKTPPALPGATVVEALQAELNAVRAQSRLLGSVLWWYLMPLTIGALIATWGLGIGLYAMIPVALMFAVINAVIVWLNRWARANQLLPIEAQLEALLRSAQTGEPLEESHVAGLRPVALSMTSANHVKPVEFNVAFWQLGIYGVPGIVGIWFFWMLSQAQGSFIRMFNWPNLLWGAVSFLGGLLYTWYIQKTVKRAVGISTQGIHLLQGQKLFLWDEIKEVRPFRFLNIRNLRLITASGEKTLMHWTPLERHSDVRATVEKFAPANHPIRQYLPLLRPESNKKTIMKKIILIVVVLATLGAMVFVRAKEAKAPAIAYTDPASQALEAIRKKHGVPALAVIATKDGKICDRAAAGVRKQGDPTPITTNDVVHIGSCTKSMTATLAAMLIEQGKLRWDTTIAEVFPELNGKMDKQYEAVTIEQLLHNCGGVPGEPPAAAWKRAWEEIGTPKEQRRDFIEAVLAAPPAATPGTKMIYSNQGYTVVGAMLEKISGQDFESLMKEKLFQPLGMSTAGFGSPGTKDKTDQPWGHTRGLKPKPVRSDNPPAISPAGRVHCSLDDLARYAMLHLQRTNALLKPETMARLHAVPEGVTIKSHMDNYTCGWVLMKRSWAGGPVLWHNGSNTMWYMVMWLAPEKNFCVIAVTNIAGDDAEKACDDACAAMIGKWLPE